MLKNTKNYYEILGVTPDIEPVQLKTVYRKLVRKYHPDINPEGCVIFKDITEAYEVLSDEKLKKQYDTINGFFKTAKKTEISGDIYRKSFKKRQNLHLKQKKHRKKMLKNKEKIFKIMNMKNMKKILRM